MVDQLKRINKSNVITAIISIAATFVVGWLTIKISSDKSLEAAFEREIKVKESIVRIVEQNILNERPLDIARLRRLIEAKSVEQRINKYFQPIDILKTAELNLLSSDLLDQDKKELIKASFDSIYANLSISSGIVGNDSLEINNQKLIDKINTDLQSGKVTDVSNNINKLINYYNSKIIELKSEKDRLQNVSPSSDRIYLYVQMIQIIIIFIYLYLFMLYGRRWLGNVDYKVYRRIRRAIMYLMMLSLLPFYIAMFMRIILQ